MANKWSVVKSDCVSVSEVLFVLLFLRELISVFTGSVNRCLCWSESPNKTI